ncbi:MAG: transposase [Candidatus Thiodiazotropha sp.]
MARANRHFLPGHVWHITHRCHKKEFLLKFSRDRQRWMAWLFEAKKRYGLDVLNYTVTSNHIHLLVFDNGNQAIAKSMQLIAGRTAQEYNNRKQRKGAFWEDRYHATAVEAGEHLARCLVYIDLNMVRAGVVDHPASWKHSGYQEIQAPPSRYTIINRTKLRELLQIGDDQMLIDTHREWVEDALHAEDVQRQGYWTDNLAVGNTDYVCRVKQAIGIKARKRQIVATKLGFAVRESLGNYSTIFNTEIDGLSAQTAAFSDESYMDSVSCSSPTP